MIIIIIQEVNYNFTINIYYEHYPIVQRTICKCVFYWYSDFIILVLPAFMGVKDYLNFNMNKNIRWISNDTIAVSNA